VKNKVDEMDGRNWMEVIMCIEIIRWINDGSYWIEVIKII